MKVSASNEMSTVRVDSVVENKWLDEGETYRREQGQRPLRTRKRAQAQQMRRRTSYLICIFGKRVDRYCSKGDATGDEDQQKGREKKEALRKARRSSRSRFIYTLTTSVP